MGSGITYNKEMFNTEPLLNELNNIIKERLESMLQEFLFKYKLFEENYNAVLNLPSFKHNIGTYKSFNLNGDKSNKKKKSTKKLSIIKNLLEKNKLLQEEINKLKGVNIIDLTKEVVIKEEPIIIRLEKENIRLNIEEDSIVEDNNDNICCDCECRVILDSDITIVDGKKYCGVCVPEQDDEDEESDASSVASLEEESDKEEDDKEESDKEESDKEEDEEDEEESDKEESDKEEDDKSLEEESDKSLEEEEVSDKEEDIDTEASDEESVDEPSNDLASEEEKNVEEEVVEEAVVEEDEELFEIEIDDETYCTNNFIL